MIEQKKAVSSGVFENKNPGPVMTDIIFLGPICQQTYAEVLRKEH